MDLVRSYEFFKPEKCDGRVHIIGCGAVGSTVAENIARLGITKVSLYDFDTVEAHNVANQMFFATDIGKLKVDAVYENMKRINPEIETGSKGARLFKHGYSDQPLDGYVFLAVDNIELRKKICEDNAGNPAIKGIFDIRIGLEDAQHFAADWQNVKDQEKLLSTMQFTQAEADEQQPVSACNQPLSVAPTIRYVCSIAVANFMRMVKGEPWKHTVFANPFTVFSKAY